MHRTVFLLPPEQLNHAQAAYRAAVAAKRLRLFLGLGVLFVLLGLAGVAGEVNLAALLANIHRFPAYIWNILPALSFANFRGDLAEWLWNLKDWLKLLVDTLLIAYLGTLLGALGGFALCFFATANLERRNWIRIVC